MLHLGSTDKTVVRCEAHWAKWRGAGNYGGVAATGGNALGAMRNIVNGPSEDSCAARPATSVGGHRGGDRRLPSNGTKPRCGKPDRMGKGAKLLQGNHSRNEVVTNLWTEKNLLRDKGLAGMT